MENEEKKDEGRCCSKGRCCCGGKAFAALLLLAVGGLGGYLCGRRCAVKEAAPAAPAATPAK